MQQIDSSIIEWIRETLVADWLTPLMRAITFFGEYGIGWIAIALILLAFPKTRRAGVTMGIALLLGFLLGEVFLKNVIGRPRPFTLLQEIRLLIPAPSGFSCPSGHTTSSFAAATSIFLCHKKPGIAPLVMAALVAFSRLYFSVHYLTDVLFGTLLGIGCAWVAWRLAGLLWKKRKGQG